MIDILTSCNFFDVDYFLKNTIRNSFGPLAQLVEQFPFKEWVTGSNPVRLTRKSLNCKLINYQSPTSIDFQEDLLARRSYNAVSLASGAALKSSASDLVFISYRRQMYSKDH